MATPVRRVKDMDLAANPNVVKAVFDHRGRALYFSRSPLPFWRDGDKPYFFKHIGIYVYRDGYSAETYGLNDFNLMVPEPAEWAFLGVAVIVAAAALRRRASKPALAAA